MSYRQKRVRDFAKLHHPDPSGFWNLVRTGEKLPKVGEQILFVKDIRGTSAELTEQLFVRIANGDPYRCGLVNKKKPGEKVYEHEVLIDEALKLPTEVSPPRTRVGIVEEVGFNEIFQEWYITIQAERGWPGFHIDPCHIIYWAPFPAAPDTYTPRTGDDDDPYYLSGCYNREERVMCYLERRKARLNRDS